jgi:hypothetical protein
MPASASGRVERGQGRPSAHGIAIWAFGIGRVASDGPSCGSEIHARVIGAGTGYGAPIWEVQIDSGGFCGSDRNSAQSVRQK